MMKKAIDVRTDIFKGFTEEQLFELRSILMTDQYPAGVEIISQNQRATDLYILISGEVEITHRPYDGPSITVAKVKAGGVFGWSALLGREKYSSTVTALADCNVYHVRGFKLQQFCERHQETGVVLLEKMALSVSQQPTQTHELIMKIFQSAMEYREDNSSEVSK